MATPANMSATVDEMLDILSSTINPLGTGRRTSIVNEVCVFCNGPATRFRNEISRKEFTISGMCQPCQDEMFGTD